MICDFAGTDGKKRTPAFRSRFLAAPRTPGEVERKRARYQRRTDIVAQMFAFVKPCAEKFFRACQGRTFSPLL